MMSEQRTLLETTISGLQRSRDELRLQLHLAEMDAKEEYERLTGKVEDLATQYEPVKDAVGNTAENVYAALLLAADEVRRGFDRVRASVKSE